MKKIENVQWEDRGDMMRYLFGDIAKRTPTISILEIGVFKGEFSRQMLEIATSTHGTGFVTFQGVDPFEGIITSGDEHGNNIETISGDDAVDFATKNLIDYQAYYNGLNFPIGSHINLYQTTSDTFFNNLQVSFSTFKPFLKYKSLYDVIYIDGRHEYEFVKKDLQNALAVIRKCEEECFLCGHDYSEEHFPDVVRAVSEILEENPELEPVGITKGNLPSFAIRVPSKE